MVSTGELLPKIASATGAACRSKPGRMVAAKCHLEVQRIAPYLTLDALNLRLHVRRGLLLCWCACGERHNPFGKEELEIRNNKPGKLYHLGITSKMVGSSCPSAACAVMLAYLGQRHPMMIKFDGNGLLLLPQKPGLNVARKQS